MRIAYSKVFPLALLIVLGLLIWWLNETSSMHIAIPKGSAETPDLTAFQVTGVRFDQKGKPVDKLVSAQLLHYQANNITWLILPVLEHTVDGRARLNVLGVKAKLLQDSNVLFMYDKVKLVRDAFADKPMMTVYTSDVEVNLINQTAQSSSSMRAIAGKSHINAVGFYFDNKNEVLNLHNQVKVTYVKEK